MRANKKIKYDKGMDFNYYIHLCFCNNLYSILPAYLSRLLSLGTF